MAPAALVAAVQAVAAQAPRWEAALPAPRARLLAAFELG